MAQLQKYKHLTLSNRITIETELSKNSSIREISRILEKSPSTISYEIALHRIYQKPNNFNGTAKDQNCIKLSSPSSVCNGCETKKHCRKTKYYYRASDSHVDYRNLLVSSRQGIDMTIDEFDELNKIVEPSIKNGHSFYMIIQNYPQINITERCLYYYQQRGYLTTMNIDLPRKVRYKQRKRNASKLHKDRTIRIGRNYKDFEAYISNNNITHYVQMDTVEGKKGGECLLTLLFVPENFLLAFKLKEQTASEVSRVITSIKTLIGYDNFYLYFRVILTDNGHEFTDVKTIEDNGETIKESKLFFCDPRRSEQKGAIEVTHEYIRKFIPKSIEFANYTDINIENMVNHINSTSRKMHKGKTPFELLTKRMPIDLLEKIGCKMIVSTDVILNDRLFK